jgi:hypothetical protein
MSLFPDITPLINQFNQFSHTQSQNQLQMIALLKQISQQLTQIQQNQK